MTQKGDANDINITTYDRLLRAWENSMEMTRDFESHSKQIEDEEIRKLFKQFAEDEGMHASKLRELILERQSRSHEN
jgi:rubrerythrin